MCDALREFFKDELQEANERGLATGTANGKAEDIIELLNDVGKVSEELSNVIYERKNLEVLKKWLKLAARAESIDAFETAIGLVK